MLRKITSLILSFCLLFTQTGFAQAAAVELNLFGYFNRMASNLTVDKFRPLHLRYLSYDSLSNNFNLLIDKGDQKGTFPKGTPSEQKLKEETRQLLNYFFIGLALPNESFWVNLRPDSPDNIIDPKLAKTDIGRIFLEADLQLKKDTASFTSPQTPEGKEYWDKLYKKAGELYGSENITIPTLTRPWIVPGEIIIRESKDNAYIYKATLKVMLEQDYLKDLAAYSFKDERSKTLNEYSSQLIRELIIPKLTKEVNSSKRYAPFRQVYYSLILAQWFKQKFPHQQGRSLADLTSKEDWSKTTYFNAYKKSFAEGEYNIKEPVYTPTGQAIRSYFSGGIKIGGMSPAVFNIAGSPVEKKPYLMPVAYRNGVVTQPLAGSSPIGNKTILYVDDDSTFLSLRADGFRLKGYKVVTASDGKEALEIMETQHIDLVITDIQMPIMDGLEFTRELEKKQQNGEKMPPIIISASFNSPEFSLIKSLDIDFVELNTPIKELVPIINQKLKKASPNSPATTTPAWESLDRVQGLRKLLHRENLATSRNIIIFDYNVQKWGVDIVRLGALLKYLLAANPELKITVVCGCPELIGLFPGVRYVSQREYDRYKDRYITRFNPATDLVIDFGYGLSRAYPRERSIPLINSALPDTSAYNEYEYWHRFAKKIIGLKDGEISDVAFQRRSARSDVIFVNPNGQTSAMAVSRKQWVELISKLLNSGYSVALSSGELPEEKIASRDIESKVRAESGVLEGRLKVVDFSDKGKLVDFLAGEVRAVLTIDTSIFHLAYRFGIPTVVITTNHSGGWIPKQRDNFRAVDFKEISNSDIIIDLLAGLGIKGRPVSGQSASYDIRALADQEKQIREENLAKVRSLLSKENLRGADTITIFGFNNGKWGDEIVQTSMLIKCLLTAGPHLKINVVGGSPELLALFGENVKYIPLGSYMASQREFTGRFNKEADIVIDFAGGLSNLYPGERRVQLSGNIFPGITNKYERWHRFAKEIIGIDKVSDTIFKREGRIPNVILVNPHAITQKRTVDIKDWVRIINKLLSGGFKIVLNAGETPADEYRTEYLRKVLKLPGTRILRETKNGFVNYLSGKIDAVVTIDTAVFHLAHRFGIPAVVITGNDYNGWIPGSQENFRSITAADTAKADIIGMLTALGVKSEQLGSPAADSAKPGSSPLSSQERVRILIDENSGLLPLINKIQQVQGKTNKEFNDYEREIIINTLHNFLTFKFALKDEELAYVDSLDNQGRLDLLKKDLKNNNFVSPQILGFSLTDTLEDIVSLKKEKHCFLFHHSLLSYILVFKSQEFFNIFVKTREDDTYDLSRQRFLWRLSYSLLWAVKLLSIDKEKFALEANPQKNDKGASPLQNNQDDLGGIDMRYLAKNAIIEKQGQSPAGTVPVFASKELEEIQRLIQAGIIPATKRLEECRGACSAEALLSCIADILRIEEERVTETEAGLKNLLASL